MGLLLSTSISEIQQETKTRGERITDSDVIVAFKRANQYFNSTYKMPTAQREQDLLVYPGVYEYAAPSDFLGWADLQRPYGLNSPKFQNVTEDELIHDFNNRKTAFKFDRETLYLLVKDDTGTGLTIHNFDDNSSNGAWSISGDSPSLAVDENFFTQGSASLKFTITYSGGTTTLVNSTLSAVDLTDYKDVGKFFVELMAPSGNTSAITSVRLRIGSSASAYYEMTSTTRFRGDNINAGKGLIGFDFTSYTTTGSPTVTALNYVQLVITGPASGANGAYRIDNLFVALPTLYELPYYSQNNVKTTGGAYQQHPTATTDTILCPSDAENAYLYKVMEICAVHFLKDNSLAQYAARELEPYERTLKKKYPSQEKQTSNVYYRRFK